MERYFAARSPAVETGQRWQDNLKQIDATIHGLYGIVYHDGIIGVNSTDLPDDMIQQQDQLYRGTYASWVAVVPSVWVHFM